ncbi:hypothetical protein CDL15_Pgr021864 [Punica granatum]|uniref:Uncharacterized protein n=1 Tax=Punica granatum TaxID=22663 RepID=A0A218WT60_PUNGR|nr:hypothetical protein CDL15_Pgr021864 [Punica granatum]
MGAETDKGGERGTTATSSSFLLLTLRRGRREQGFAKTGLEDEARGRREPVARVRDSMGRGKGSWQLRAKEKEDDGAEVVVVATSR